MSGAARSGLGRRARWGLAIAAAALSLALPSRAEASCGVMVWSTIRFGTYDVFSTTALDSNGMLIYWCRNNERNVRVTLSRGASPTYQPRTLVSGTDILPYNIYLDAARTRIWGDGTGGTQVFIDPNPSDNWFNAVYLYGRIPAQQDAAAGTYFDTITVVINY